ncbi:MAG: hypothetical protein H0X05_01940 [Actinobacteria bacterium]|nr:hypothetical protein [Actinomycetota bacterium]
MRGASITVRCDCGQVQYVSYGDTWQCPECSRRWDTNQIPADQYWSIMKEMRDERVKVIVGALVVAGGFAAIAVTQGPAAWALAPVVVGAWLLVFMPRWRRRLREKARSIPTWQLRPD